MSTRVTRGPWLDQPLTFYCSTNGGETAFSVTANDERRAAQQAYSRLHEAVFEGVDQDDPFALDSALSELNALMGRLQIYTPQAWTAKCHADLLRERGGLTLFCYVRRSEAQDGQVPA